MGQLAKDPKKACVLETAHAGAKCRRGAFWDRFLALCSAPVLPSVPQPHPRRSAASISSSSATSVSPAPLPFPSAPPALSALTNGLSLSIAPAVPCTHTLTTSPSYLRAHALVSPAAPTGSFSRFFPRSYLGRRPFSPSLPRWPPATTPGGFRPFLVALSPPCTTAHRAIYDSSVAYPSSPPLADIPAASHALSFRTPRVHPSSLRSAVSRRV
ncbi:hypothetical protein NUW54_g11006 [Trametes sanguinea]|uniref:Uncharacterized protein n=1 Tax=Trametes sanguinea TaxID=158606 RepID=A0ACC1NME8_9APHY|nr:hypothetical protein NUW54_g11006 [Trametes sanguinea]